MAKLRKIDVYIDTLAKRIEAHTAYSEGTFFVALTSDLTDFFESQNPKAHGYSIGEKKTTGKTKQNPYGLASWHSRGKHYNAVTGATEKEAEENWQEFMRAFYKQSQTVEKVILFKMSFSSMTIGDYSDGYHYRSKRSTGPKFERRDNERTAQNADSDEYKARIEFDFMACEKRSLAGKESFFFIDSEGKQDRIDADRYDWQVMPYTPEAEVFLSDIYKGLETIMEKLHKFIGTPDRVQKAIDSSQKLLA